MARTPDDTDGPRAERAEDEAPVATPLDADGGAAARWRGGIPPRWRRPLLGLLTVGLVVGVAVGLFARSTSDPRAALGKLLGAPTATPALLPVPAAANDTVAAVHGVPWGSLTISGQPVPPAQMAGALFQLSPGQHQLVYTAAGFPTLRCIISVPPATSDTCPLANPNAVSDVPIAYTSARVLDLLATPARLAPAQRAALDAAISRTLATLGGTATISPGDRYADPISGATLRASVTLTYSVTPEIATPDEARAHLNGLGGQPCGPICASGTDPQQAQTSESQSGWRLEVMVRPTRAVTLSDGQRLSNEQADARDVGPASLLAARTAAGWQVSPDPMALLHLPGGVAQLASLFCPQSLDLSVQSSRGPSKDIGSAEVLSAPNPADGCIIAFLRIPPTPCASACAPLPPYLLIIRFGVVEAANDMTFQAYWSLPLA
ncbi:MAG: hypothetical protein KGO05_04060, partial [Chloroflexota bacterium]|nr:hypothetical protein [Chloroflexota bacterium]